jgi:hypothetical protein
LWQISSFSRRNSSQLIEILFNTYLIAIWLYRIVKDIIYVLFNHLCLRVLIWLWIFLFFGIQIFRTYNNFVYIILIILLFTQKMLRLLILMIALLVKINSLFLQIKLFCTTHSLNLVWIVIFLILTFKVFKKLLYILLWLL